MKKACAAGFLALAGFIGYSRIGDAEKFDSVAFNVNQQSVETQMCFTNTTGATSQFQVTNYKDLIDMLEMIDVKKARGCDKSPRDIYACAKSVATIVAGMESQRGALDPADLSKYDTESAKWARKKIITSYFGSFSNSSKAILKDGAMKLARKHFVILRTEMECEALPRRCGEATMDPEDCMGALYATTNVVSHPALYKAIHYKITRTLKATECVNAVENAVAYLKEFMRLYPGFSLPEGFKQQVNNHGTWAGLMKRLGAA